ncbi:LysR family transcriptional regulator [Mucilaginibacter agri]|uniref:LysR family transcriptional regulator n=1 Tax=Mucilaginibacter agri TaxID=2695265 RepID=A0A965ZMU9_9SPHI|nr:LysR family transcriptional regulator [Mucilaginibacter agri]NCD72482.1 LysR family transcriptional regulator [Mucilaginibacter agri]
MLNLEWLRTFKVIYEAGSLSAAAQVLFISQPGVSLHLNSLETYIGQRLFERDTRKMTPTDKGTTLYHAIIDPVTKLEETEHVFHRKAKALKATINIGMYFETFQYTLEPHISELSFNLVTHFGEYMKMLQELHSGTLDLILTPHNGTQHNLEFTPAIRERIVLICGKNTQITDLHNIIAGGNKPEVHTWLSKQIWYTTTDKEYLKKFWAHNFDTLPTFQPNYVLPYFSSVLRSLRNGQGFAIVPEFLCEKDLKEETVKRVWDDDCPLERILYFGKRKNTLYSSELKQLEGILTRSMAQKIIGSFMHIISAKQFGTSA